MRQTLLSALLALGLAVPARAEPPEEGPLLPDAEMLEELAETLRGALGGLAGQLQPWGDRLGAVLANPEDYEPPELLPNGDVIIRRRPEAEREGEEPEPGQGLDL
jgi:hypothetical protein